PVGWMARKRIRVPTSSHPAASPHHAASASTRREPMPLRKAEVELEARSCSLGPRESFFSSRRSFRTRLMRSPRLAAIWALADELSSRAHHRGERIPRTLHQRAVRRLGAREVVHRGSDELISPFRRGCPQELLPEGSAVLVVVAVATLVEYHP